MHIFYIPTEIISYPNNKHQNFEIFLIFNTKSDDGKKISFFRRRCVQLKMVKMFRKVPIKITNRNLKFSFKISIYWKYMIRWFPCSHIIVIHPKPKKWERFEKDQLFSAAINAFGNGRKSVGKFYQNTPIKIQNFSKKIRFMENICYKDSYTKI